MTYKQKLEDEHHLIYLNQIKSLVKMGFKLKNFDCLDDLEDIIEQKSNNACGSDNEEESKEKSKDSDD